MLLSLSRKNSYDEALSKTYILFFTLPQSEC